MQPVIWGPALWQCMFTCAWHCPSSKIAQLTRFVRELVPTLLPCNTCKQHFKANCRKADRHTKGIPSTPEDTFVWLWYLKNNVNMSTKSKSIPLDLLYERYAFHAGTVLDQIAFADALVLVAINAQSHGLTDEFVNLCEVASELLAYALPSRGHVLVSELKMVTKPVIAGALHVARMVRVAYDRPPLTRTHYIETSKK